MVKTTRGSPLTGLRHIVPMTTWDEGSFNEEVQALIEFEAALFLDGRGSYYSIRGGRV
jgi:hypothetical protein